MIQREETGIDRDSWESILSRCGPGLDESDRAATALGADVSDRGGPASGARRVLSSRLAAVASLALAASIAIPIGMPRTDSAGEQRPPASELKTGSITGFQQTLSAALVSPAPLAGQQPPGFQESTPRAAVGGNSASETPAPQDSVGGPFVPAPLALPAGNALEARLAPPGTRAGDGTAGTGLAGATEPEAATLYLQMRLRDMFAQSQIRTFLADSTTLSAQDAQVLIDRGKEMMRLGDVVTARLVFTKVMDSGFAEGAFNLAQTYDPKILRGLPVHSSIVADAEKARTLYALSEETEKKISLSR